LLGCAGARALPPRGGARGVACAGGAPPAVLGSSGEPRDLGRKPRTVSTALRRALVLRDHGCAFPGCTIPACWTDGHHIQHWADGGSTSLENMVLLCSAHHDLIHHSAWTVRLRDVLPEFIPPTFIDPEQRP